MQQSGAQPDPEPPGPLTALLNDPACTQRRDLFIKCRKEFKADRNVSTDLKAYEDGDNKHSYTIVKGFVPQSLVGKSFVDGKAPFEKSETFFTNFEKHYPEEYILSATDKSFIIGNRESHDVRLYSASCDPGYQDKRKAAGMSFMHLMVIPRNRLYNIVSLELEDIQIIDEMILHFENFWKTPGSIQKSLDRIQLATKYRIEDIIEGYKKNPETEVERTKEFTDIIHNVRESADGLAEKLRSLSADDFFFAFHPAPEATVGHLHMHVLPKSREFRRYSTGEHDWKTIPAVVVKEVIHGEIKPDGRLPGT